MRDPQRSAHRDVPQPRIRDHLGVAWCRNFRLGCGPFFFRIFGTPQNDEVLLIVLLNYKKGVPSKRKSDLIAVTGTL